MTAPRKISLREMGGRDHRIAHEQGDMALALAVCHAVLVALENTRRSDNPRAKPVSALHLAEPSVKTIAAEMDKPGAKRLIMISARGVADSFAVAL